MECPVTRTIDFLWLRGEFHKAITMSEFVDRERGSLFEFNKLLTLIKQNFMNLLIIIYGNDIDRLSLGMLMVMTSICLSSCRVVCNL
jgi:hypothetical protein